MEYGAERQEPLPAASLMRLESLLDTEEPACLSETVSRIRPEQIGPVKRALCELIDRDVVHGLLESGLSFARAAIGHSQRKEMLGSMREARRAGM